MVFSDLFFIFVFLPAFILCYLLAKFIDKQLAGRSAERTHMARNVVLVLFSLLFYAWGEPIYVFLMLISVALNYMFGRIIDRSKRYSKIALVFGLICDLLMLGTFKYAGFFAGILTNIGIPTPDPGIALPIGISFYTFQAISYLVDVYRRVSPAQKSYGDLLLYISMFPQLIAGPIVRYETVAREITDRKVTAEDLSDGIFRFMLGLAKKVIIANQFSELSTQFLGGDLNAVSSAGALVGILAFTLQIYFDFSGYSDMAIGIGRCLGFHFNENFDHPYCCRTITDFWRRWHISLGSFFRDYVYIPLGGNRRHQAVNLLAVWFLTGLWHGASWNFVLWGLYFGVIVMLEKYTILKIKGRGIPVPLLHLYSLVLIVLGWGIFYFDDFGRMQQFFEILFSGRSFTTDFVAQTALTDKFWLWIVAILFCMPVRRWISRLSHSMFGSVSWLDMSVSTTARIVTSAVLLVVSVALLIGATNNAFLYTRF